MVCLSARIVDMTLRITFLVFCILAVASGSQDPDFNKLAKIASQIQSATAKKDLTSLTIYAKELIDAIPSDDVFRSIGIGSGKATTLFYNKASHLVGMVSSFPLNIWEVYDEDCVYIDEKYFGPVIIYTGKSESVKTCRPDKYLSSWIPKGYSTLVTSDDTLRLSSDLSMGIGKSFFRTLPDTYDKLKRDTAFAIPPDQFHPSDIPAGEPITFLAGKIVRQGFAGEAKFRRFVPYKAIKFNRMGEYKVEEDNECADCPESVNNLSPDVLRSYMSGQPIPPSTVPPQKTPSTPLMENGQLAIILEVIRAVQAGEIKLPAKTQAQETKVPTKQTESAKPKPSEN